MYKVLAPSIIILYKFLWTSGGFFSSWLSVKNGGVGEGRREIYSLHFSQESCRLRMELLLKHSCVCI